MECFACVYIAALTSPGIVLIPEFLPPYLLLQQFLCAQTVVGNVYKGLTAQQSHLNIKLSGVKSSITLGPLSTIELAAALSVAVQSWLAEHGWSQLDKQHFVGSNVWDLAPSGQQTCRSVKVSVACHAPAYAVLRVETGAPSSLGAADVSTVLLW